MQISKQVIQIFGFVLVLCSEAGYSQPEVRVFGKNYTTEIKYQAQLHLAHLGVNEDVLVDIRFSPNFSRDFFAISVPYRSAGSQSYDIFHIFVDNRLSDKRIKKVIAHEMVHVKQYVKHELKKISKHSVLWKGKSYQYSVENILEMPWEEEAYQMDHKLVQIADCIQEYQQELFAGKIAQNKEDSCRCANLECENEDKHKDLPKQKITKQ